MGCSGCTIAERRAVNLQVECVDFGGDVFIQRSFEILRWILSRLGIIIEVCYL